MSDGFKSLPTVLPPPFDFSIKKISLGWSFAIYSFAGFYEMSGGTGSRRFMAPEVALGQPYNLSADIYSFSILFWELVALEKAFGKLSQDEHREMVIKKNDRPPLKRDWRLSIQCILQNCWARNPRERTSANELYKQLKEQVDSYYEDGFESYEEGREKKLCI
mmetsp:Transcript_12160/g.13766  ORF Transcript_12160/g.13766 Transcript_12160/m.13766 type:complete len:163 (+) Transcript_12160:989-1477(+)